MGGTNDINLFWAESIFFQRKHFLKINLFSGIWFDMDLFFENQFILFVWHEKS